MNARRFPDLPVPAVQAKLISDAAGAAIVRRESTEAEFGGQAYSFPSRMYNEPAWVRENLEDEMG
jgi:hypothetical protein